MKAVILLALGTGAALTARADFSYTMANKAAGAAPTAGGLTMKYSLKGQKMKVDNGDTVTILDFEAQTITTIRHNQKTYEVRPMSDLSKELRDTKVNATVDFKETGQKKNINGYNANQMIMTMAIDAPQAAPAGMKLQAEMEIWFSSEVPGAQELKSFYDRNSSRFPWTALGGGASAGNESIQSAIVDMQKKLASMGGVPVMQIVRVKPAGNSPQAAQLQGNMAQARARLEEMAKQGGPAAAAAQQALARLPAASGGGAMFENTMESRDFSTSSIAESAFAIPSGYQKLEKTEK